VNLRTKLLLIFVALAFLPLLVVSVLSYLTGVTAVKELLRVRADERASRMTRRIGRVLDKQATRLVELSKGQSLREYVRASQQQQGAGASQPRAAAAVVPDTVDAHFRAFFNSNREHLKSVACLDSKGEALFRLTVPSDSADGEIVFQTSNFVSGEVHYEHLVWTITRVEALRSPVEEESYGAAQRVTVPVVDPSVADDAQPIRTIGAIVAEVRLEGLIEDAAAPESLGAEDAAKGVTGQPQTRAQPNIIALDNAGDIIVYHTNSGFRQQKSVPAMPYFADLSARMKSGEEGFGFYDESNGGRRLAAFRQARGLGLSLAVAEDYAAAVGPVRRSGLFGIALALLAGLGALALLLIISRRERRDIARVTRGASAIAAGHLDQRIEVSRSGETRELAENFNRMSDRLRELIAREAETRQFQSFVRISAMISHDLKNAIAGLSMLVTNMERQFHREEFRADAIESLREATEKLKRTVARLSEPVKSMSGEYRLASRPTDLVPIIRRVLATNAEPSLPLYDIEAQLPETLVAPVERERIENVVENLVINALEAMGAKGGRLTVEAGTLEGDLVFISVADTGIGMSEEFIKTRLFRPFATTKSKGIGLGLFTCREIVETHGGRLEVESQVGAGTRFRVVLPSRLFRSDERQRQLWKTKATAARGKSEPSATD
jgi:signal transduction histidine kinase